MSDTKQRSKSKKWLKRIGVTVGAVALFVAGTIVGTGGAGAAVQALISYAQFDSQTKAKVDNTRTFTAVSSGAQVITHIGGSISANKTVLEGIDMTGFSGDFLAIVSGQVDRTTQAAKPNVQTQPQFSLWRDCDNDGNFEWQTEGIMSPNATIPDQIDRSVTITGMAKLHVYKACHTKLIAFGYNADQSSAASGELTAAKGVTVTLIPYR